MEDSVKKLKAAVNKLLWGDSHIMGVMDAIEYPYRKDQWEDEVQDVMLALDRLEELICLNEKTPALRGEGLQDVG